MIGDFLLNKVSYLTLTLKLRQKKVYVKFLFVIECFFCSGDLMNHLSQENILSPLQNQTLKKPNCKNFLFHARLTPDFGWKWCVLTEKISWEYPSLCFRII
jgi:hypothetical protein